MRHGQAFTNRWEKGSTFQWARGKTQVFFLKQKRAAVLHALQKEHVLAEQ